MDTLGRYFGDGINMRTSKYSRTNLSVWWPEPQGGGKKSLEKEQV